MRSSRAGIAVLTRAPNVTPLAYNKRVVVCVRMLSTRARTIPGADPNRLASWARQQEGEVRCSFALASSR